MTVYRIAYVGAAGSGRTTSLVRVLNFCHVVAQPLSLDTQTEHHAVFKQHSLVFLISSTRSNLYYQDPDDPHVPSEVRVEVEWLRRAHGIIFVLDSQIDREFGNTDEFEKLRRDLATRGVDLNKKPIVFQANKRDLRRIASMSILRSRFEVPRSVMNESVATEGIGTVESIAALIQLIEMLESES